MKTLLAICMIVFASFAWAAEGSAPQSAGGVTVQGKVLKMKKVDNFTYLLLSTDRGEIWAAVIDASAKKGATVTIENATVMENFHSKALNQTFKQILFGKLGSASVSPAGSSTLGAAFSANPRKNLETINAAPVAKASVANAMTVEEILTKVAELKGKPVVVRGKVVKYNAEIMGVNWIHLQDGSGSAADGSNDILVTTLATAKVGDVVTVEGIVATDKDFGAGYSYKVLIEQATLQK
ncbi:MAG: nucleotide-binding protein [Nitrosomonadales bacterium]|nr:nucleotide-binding protein [Nitrosomonadales bacterium]